MNKDQVMQTVIEQVSKKFNLPLAQVTPQTTFSSLNVDSLDVTEIVMDIEDNFNINLSDQTNMADINSLVDIIVKLLEEKNGAKEVA
jgi:acyl carrier protein